MIFQSSNSGVRSTPSATGTGSTSSASRTSSATSATSTACTACTASSLFLLPSSFFHLPTPAQNLNSWGTGTASTSSSSSTTNTLELYQDFLHYSYHLALFAFWLNPIGE